MPKLLPSWRSDVDLLRDFARIRLVVVDLDGTLISSKVSSVTDRIKRLRKLLNHQSKQVCLTIATGRTLSGVRALLLDLDLPAKIPLILYNGSVVVESGTLKTISRRTINTSILTSIVNIAFQYPVRVFAYYLFDSRAEAFMVQADIEMVRGWTTVGRVEREFNGMLVEWHVPPASDDITPSAILVDTLDNAVVSSEIANRISGLDVSATRSGSKYLEIRPAHSHKAVALQVVADHLGLTQEEILTLGDNDNDAEMLAWAGIGVAVAQASITAQASSDYICHYGVAAGAAEVLQLVIEAKRLFKIHRTNTRDDINEHQDGVGSSSIGAD